MVLLALITHKIIKPLPRRLEGLIRLKAKTVNKAKAEVAALLQANVANPGLTPYDVVILKAEAESRFELTVKED